ncbi:ATP-binding protein (plasmid) [Sphingobium xenophagum]|uniref:ATP-binding protein n=1 Tax=Sphingobium xenophagum TaxID=121428 RepID=A0A249N0R3_SPHXE|nr:MULTISPECIES: ATP-binding cassette domain-containing protein [Sphingobium]ASY47190.1 ATP-binding protein [Sphingobium xenophagum]MBG6121028.1 capsular polysaccharide transport system ATP-binding protein [Sphingobium sp. JAI105]
MISCTNIKKSYRVGHRSKSVLKGVNLTIAPGDRIGLLGRNGAGKSTLIKLIGGVEMPTSGKIRRKMTCSWPLGFNGGFQGSLTGYDNARFIARIYGQDYVTMRRFVEEFTELGKQLNMPVKTYSSGQRARLAFALSLAIEFDCYLIDEVIMVGDKNFQDKCRYELFEKRQDRSILVVSHTTDIIRECCSRVSVIKDGLLSEYDDVDEGISVYDNL